MTLPLSIPDLPDPPCDLTDSLRFRLIGIAGAGLVRLWGATLRIEWLGRENIDAVAAAGGRVIWAFWHRHLLTLTYTHRGGRNVVLVSRHKDGEIISQILCRLGYGVIRGSTTRGGLRGLLEMARAGREGHPLAVTPDGPRGPRFVLQSGILHIAQRSGLHIAPLACEGMRVSELDSWDQFQIPHPFSRVAVSIGPLIRVPTELPADVLEREWGPTVARGIDACEAAVAAWRDERRGSRGGTR